MFNIWDIADVNIGSIDIDIKNKNEWRLIASYIKSNIQNIRYILARICTDVLTPLAIGYSEMPTLR